MPTTHLRTLRLRLAVFALLIPLLFQMAHAKPKKVFAHYMVAHRGYGSSLEGYQREIKDALAYGVNGFALNIGDWRGGNYQTDTALIFKAAEGTDFQLFISADMNGGLSSDDILDIMRLYGKHSNYYHYDGRAMLSTFCGEGNKEPGEATSRSWWLNRIITPLKERGMPVYFVPFFYTLNYPPVPSYAQIKHDYDAWWHAVCDGGFDFGAGALPSYEEPSLLRSSEARARVFHEAGKTFMAPVSPLYWGDKQVSNGRVYFEYEGGKGLAAQWESVILRQQPEWVELVTWNDFGEHSTFSPIEDVSKYWPYADQAHPERGFYKCRVGIAALNRYFISWYQQGKEPEITRDLIYYAHRTHLKDAVAVHDPRGPVTNRVGPVKDVIYLTSLLTEPATLRARIGEASYEYELVAGLSHTEVPMEIGLPYFELLRDGQQVMEHHASEAIIAQPQVYNFSYASGVMGINRLKDGGFLNPDASQLGSPWATRENAVSTHAQIRSAAGHHTPGFLSHRGRVSEPLTTYQTLTNLTPGTYVMRAWARSGGGQKSAYLYAQDAANTGGKLRSAIDAGDAWQPFIIPGIRISGNQAEVGIHSESLDGQWLEVDDVEFIKVDL